jgi:GH24 family phage-related lysozyme (muramidase)
MTRTLSQNGLNLIKSFEGLKLTAYKALSTEKYYTIGYGHYGSDVTKGMKITEAQAEKLLANDCAKFVTHVNKYMSTYNFNQNQFDALVSFAYNVGSITQLTNNGKRSISDISSKILEYNKSGGKVITGLTTRRKKEQTLFNTAVKTKTNEEIAKEVLAGKWGNGTERKTALEKAGYNYTEIQKLVNKLLKG